MITEFQNPQSATCPEQSRRVRNPQLENGFSLTEVLLAIVTLAVGMLFIAGVFPVSIGFTTVASERTIAATVADEAFAKIKLYGIYDPNVGYNAQTPYENAAPALISNAEFAYPSTPTADPTLKKYWWSAICRRVSPADVQVTVFVSRKAGVTTKFYALNPLPPPIFITIDNPVAVPVEVTGLAGAFELTITGNVGDKTWINDGCTIVDGATGQVYRVLERYAPPLDDRIIRLDRSWQGGPLVPPGSVWVVGPSVDVGRYPCIAVYQKIIRF